MHCRWFAAFVGLVFVSSALADGIADNDLKNVRRVPKLGIEVSAEQRAKLEPGLAELRKAIDGLKKRNDAKTRELLPDVEIFFKAVHDALKYQEFFQPKEVDDAVKLLAAGQERAQQLAAGQAPWSTATGLVPRGYVSKIDGSVQPYGLVVPASYTDRGPGGFRLDLWFHGRGETLSELAFLRDRMNSPGQFTPQDTIVLHPYGRYSNAFKFAGETDVLEALASTQRRYRVDEERIAARGFSMGGAACWQFAVHYPDRWFAANPGAGFSETPEFLKFFQKQELNPTWWEKKLWRWYDCPDVCANLRNCPTVAYSGALDIQKQAADIMEASLAKEQIKLVHIVAPETKHAYSPAAKEEVERRMANLARGGRDRTPRQVTLVTHTLKYNRTFWLTLDGLTQHWEPARTEGMLDVANSTVTLRTSNVSALTVRLNPGESPFALDRPVTVMIDGVRLVADRPQTDRSWEASLRRDGNLWKLGAEPGGTLRKRHNLQGPIDDAFMDSFVFVRPTGQPRHALAGQWANAELDRAIEHWRRHFRGEARVKNDSQISEQDIANANLVLWGDPSSNQVLAKLADKLPIRWTAQAIEVGAGKTEQKFPADSHALIAIYPNPLNPNRYVVLNSSFTFREFAYLNNARQVPMLPDWAIVDLRTPADAIWPGKIVAADFFDEMWGVKTSLR